MTRRTWMALILLASVAFGARADGGSRVERTRHNLSASSPGSVRAQSQSEICIFCHVPHRGMGGKGMGIGTAQSLAKTPGVTTYIPYSSSTLTSPAPGAPNGKSRLCLSCHDGTLALGQTLAAGVIPMRSTAGGALVSGGANLGTDLRRSHPISFRPAEGPEHRRPMPGDPVQLDETGQLQCTSCHDPHDGDRDPVQGDFLVKSNLASALCTTCHVKAYWSTNPGAHEHSLKRFDERLGANTKYTTVRDNGCESCHRPHGAVAQGGRLLRETVSETCLVCHRGQVADTNLEAELRKPYSHPVLGGDPALHDEAESPNSGVRRLPEASASNPRHAQCVDCHNPHAAYRREERAPTVPGALSGVWGIDRSGAPASPARFEYEVCFKCHGDSANQPQRTVQPPETLRRALVDTNLRRLLDTSSAASFHPVEGPGRNPDVPSLIAPLTTASTIYCGDCHGSDAPTGPRGPHGSVYRHILVANYDTRDGTLESPTSYALCYKCHDRSAILSDATFPHAAHVVNGQTSCAACHDSHGVSSVQGNALANAHLVNFDVSVVRPNAKGALRYTAGASRSGSCALACHGKDHDELAYSPASRSRFGPRRLPAGRTR